MVYSRAMPMTRSRLSIPLAAALFALASQAFAQESPQPSQGAGASEAREVSATKKTGKAKKRRSGAKERGAKEGPVALFTGFRTLPDGSTRVFVDLSERVQVTKRDGEQELTYTLKGARLVSKNNENALDTKHFNTPVSRARLVPKDDDIELVIELRAESKPAHRVLRRDGEAAQLQIDFPAGSFPPAPEEKAKRRDP